MLYLIPTPIGNLKDITFRAVETLQNCDLILCEDTRVSQTLLRHYDIATPVKSYHQFNEASREDEIVNALKNGQLIGLISDAGTPSISDPGFRIVNRCRTENIPVSSLPGPCAVTTAISGCGLPTEKFQFVGFLPKKGGPLQQVIIDALLYSGTTAAYESPHRLVETLETIHRLHEGAKVAVCRELTKKFEEYKTGKVKTVLEHYQENPPKGEIVLLIQGGIEEKIWQSLSPIELVSHFQDSFDLSSKDALKLAAEKSRLPKRELYKKLL